MKNGRSSSPSTLLTLCFMLVFALASCGRGNSQASSSQKQQKQTQESPQKSALAAVEESLDKAEIPSSDLTVIKQHIEASPDRFFDLLTKVEARAKEDPYLLKRVDKKKSLPQDYEPGDLVLLDKTGLSVSRPGHRLRKPAYEALVLMSEAARKEGISLLVSSAYRSYAYQVEVFARNVKEMGQKEAERVSAHPGASQHQLGTAIDFGSITDAFAQTKASAWLVKNAATYGFSLSYPKGMEPITGYVWESWHYRYIGTDATALQDEYFLGVQCYLIQFLDARLS